MTTLAIYILAAAYLIMITIDYECQNHDFKQHHALKPSLWRALVWPYHLLKNYFWLRGK